MLLSSKTYTTSIFFLPCVDIYSCVYPEGIQVKYRLQRYNSSVFPGNRADNLYSRLQLQFPSHYTTQHWATVVRLFLSLCAVQSMWQPLPGWHHRHLLTTTTPTPINTIWAEESDFAKELTSWRWAFIETGQMIPGVLLYVIQWHEWQRDIG